MPQFHLSQLCRMTSIIITAAVTIHTGTMAHIMATAITDMDAGIIIEIKRRFPWSVLAGR
jgi:hypothetical protein